MKGLLHIWHRTEIRPIGSKGCVLVNANSTELVNKKILDKDSGDGVSVLKLSPFDTNCVRVIKTSKDSIAAFSRSELLCDHLCSGIGSNVFIKCYCATSSWFATKLYHFYLYRIYNLLSYFSFGCINSLLQCT